MCMQIYVLAGHRALIPGGIELCKRLTSLHCKTSLVIPSTISLLVPDTFRQSTTEVFDMPGPEVGADPFVVDTMKESVQCHLSAHRSNGRGAFGVILDVALLPSMPWLVDIFQRNHIPITGFFTSSAFSTVKEYIASSEEDKKSEGLLGCFAGCGLVRCGPKVTGLSGPGEHPVWMDFAKKFMGVMINSCDDLERPFLNELSKELKLRVWSVGPLFPREYFRLAGTAVQPSSDSEADLIYWLHSKPRRSVLLVYFGTSVDLATEEYPRLAEALAASTHPFIWVVRPDSHSSGYYPVVNGAGDRGLVANETVPHSKILNHPCIAGFLSHCDWEPMMEAIGLGVPLLAWPKRGDQFYNAKLAVKKLRVGHYVCYTSSKIVNAMVTVKGIGDGIDILMADKQMKKRTADLGSHFSSKFPQTSTDALDRFTEDLALL